MSKRKNNLYYLPNIKKHTVESDSYHNGWMDAMTVMRTPWILICCVFSLLSFLLGTYIEKMFG